MNTPIPVQKSPVSNKVWSASGSAGVVGLVVGGIIDAVPWLRNNIPSSYIPLIPGFLASLGAFVGGYRAKHRPTAAEILQEITSSEALVKTVESIVHPPVFQITGTSTSIPTLDPVPDKPYSPPTIVGEHGPELPDLPQA